MLFSHPSPLTPHHSPLTPHPSPLNMTGIHISTARKMLNAPEPLDIKLWTAKGEIQLWKRCISLRYDFYKGTRNMKLLDSNQIRKLRDCCIFEINGISVFM